MRRLNWTTIGLIGGLAVLLIVIAYFVTSRNPDQDKLSDSQLATTDVPSVEKRCASSATYELIKRELFRRAAQMRGSDQAAYDKLAAYAVVRMENPVMESEDKASGGVNCSGSLSLDVPPGVAVVGGRRTLMADVDYTVQPAADGTGPVVLLRNADAIIVPLATLARVSEAAQPTVTDEGNEVSNQQVVENVAASESANVQPAPAPAPNPYPGRPSFDCSQARSRGEIAVCSDSGLSALDVNMAKQFGRAIANGSPGQRQLLEQTRSRFLRYRDRCPNRQCMADAYVGRMREIRDIMEGRWRIPQ